MNVAYLQTSPAFGDKERNFQAIEDILGAHAGGASIDLLVLPELFSTGYAFASREETETLAEAADGPTALFLRRVADRTKGVVVAGFAERDGNRLYNSSLIVNAKRTIGTYRKIHLFNKEKLFFSPGEAPPPVFSVGGLVLGVMICFDWYFPETMRLLMLQGAEIVAHPANLVLPYCQEAMKTRCLENRLYAVTANRVGREERGEDDFHFTGASQITALDGSLLSVAPAEEPSLRVVRIDPASARRKNINPYNDLIGDRRVELYGGLVSSPEAERVEEK